MEHFVPSSFVFSVSCLCEVTHLLHPVLLNRRFHITLTAWSRRAKWPQTSAFWTAAASCLLNIPPGPFSAGGQIRSDAFFFSPCAFPGDLSLIMSSLPLKDVVFIQNVMSSFPNFILSTLVVPWTFQLLFPLWIITCFIFSFLCSNNSCWDSLVHKD